MGGGVPPTLQVRWFEERVGGLFAPVEQPRFELLPDCGKRDAVREVAAKPCPPRTPRHTDKRNRSWVVIGFGRRHVLKRYFMALSLGRIHRIPDAAKTDGGVIVGRF